MDNFEKCIDDLIEGIEVGMGVDGTHWASIEKTVKLLKFLRDDLMDLENFTERGMQDLLLEAIHSEE